MIICLMFVCHLFVFLFETIFVIVVIHVVFHNINFVSDSMINPT